MNDKTQETLAALEHIQWNHWMNYMFTKCIYTTSENGITTLSFKTEQLLNWNRLMKLRYDELTEQEKESDRSWAQKVIDILEK